MASAANPSASVATAQGEDDSWHHEQAHSAVCVGVTGEQGMIKTYADALGTDTQSPPSATVSSTLIGTDLNESASDEHPGLLVDEPPNGSAPDDFDSYSVPSLTQAHTKQATEPGDASKRSDSEDITISGFETYCAAKVLGVDCRVFSGFESSP